VKRPLDDTVPAVAVQEVAPEDVNCCVAPNWTVADVGAIVCGGGGPLARNVAANTAPIVWTDSSLKSHATCRPLIAGRHQGGGTDEGGWQVHAGGFWPFAPLRNPVPVMVTV